MKIGDSRKFFVWDTEPQKNLFLICPLSTQEDFINKHFGGINFFLSSIGGVFNFEEIDYLELLAEFIEKERIKNIYFTKDIDCPFVSDLLSSKKVLHPFAETVLSEIYVDNYFEINNMTRFDAAKKISLLSMQKQIDELSVHSYLGNLISKQKIGVGGIILSKKDDVVSEVLKTTKEFAE